MRKATEAKETPREGVAGSVHEIRPNLRLQRTRPRWQFLLNPKSSGRGLTAEANRYTHTIVYE